MTPATVLRRAAARVRVGMPTMRAVLGEMSADRFLLGACVAALSDHLMAFDSPSWHERAVAMEAAADAWEAANPGKVEAP